MTAFPEDYIERVYAGVLGKIIGVYLGRPFEGWEHARILEELGEIKGYVNEEVGLPLVIPDDDISGTFTFVRALEDYGYSPQLTAAQIGQTWLNYLVENETILSWAGLGCSTEHTAYLRLKRGIPAPQSGSIELNGRIVAEQIGSQIFIDSWAMLFPGNPQLAAELAGKAASVSHDGEAIYGAQVLAAMEAQAFVERDIDRLLDVGQAFAPPASSIHRMIRDLRDFRAHEPDWYKARQFVVDHYGYDKYPGGCHIVPNQALIILGLLYGGDDFQKSLLITNTCGWDTDCNSGNLGCLLGIKNGLAGIDGSPVDWRGPVADRLYLPTADGGRAITDAVSETYHLVNSAYRLAGQAPPTAPKNGARYNFELPGSVQGFQVEPGMQAEIANTEGHSRLGARSLAIHVTAADEAQPAHVATYTFIPPDAINMPGYGLLASPTLYPGQTVTAEMEAGAANEQPLEVQLYLDIYGPDDKPQRILGPAAQIAPGARQALTWRVPQTDRLPIFAIGLQIACPGTLYLDSLTWDGMPHTDFGQPTSTKSLLWRRAWVNGVDHWEWWSGEPFRLVKNEGRGMAAIGTREWQDCCFSAVVRPAFLAEAGGIAINVQGMQRFYALLLRRGCVQLVKALDGLQVLAERPLAFELWQEISLSLQATIQRNAEGGEVVRLVALVDGENVFDFVDAERPLLRGGAAFVVDEAHILADHVNIRPAAAGT
ncbi:MAG: ADP-ribosylglycohydrolase family protein [Caldilineaceae bacterium]